MRFLIKISWPVEAGNRAAKEGFKAVPSILEEIKPEAAYFYEENGKRTTLLVVDLQDASQMPAVAEPWFLAFNAAIEFPSGDGAGRSSESRAGHRAGGQELRLIERAGANQRATAVTIRARFVSTCRTNRPSERRSPVRDRSIGPLRVRRRCIQLPSSVPARCECWFVGKR